MIKNKKTSIKFNGEGYVDPTAYEALKKVIKNEKHIYRPLIYVCSPYRGNTIKNTENARLFCRYVINEKGIPFAPHLLFPQFMKDSDKNERELAMFFNKIFLKKCDELWVFGKEITSGMSQEIEIATHKNIKIRYINTEKIIR